MIADDRRIITFAALCIAIMTMVQVPAQASDAAAYPSKPIHLVVATVPGVPPDVVARILAEPLQASLRQPVIVENRPGAIGSIGLAAVAHAAADGYTIGMFAMPYVVGPSMIKVPYDVAKDFAPVTLVSRAYSMVAVRADAPARSVDDVVGRARAHPGEVTFASAGNGTPSHLAGALLQQETATKMLHVPYKGAAAVTALLTGDVDFMISSAYVVWPHVKSGRLRVLAVTAPRRLDAYPDVPTLVELGYPEVQITDWQGIVAPAGTPPAVIARLRSELATILATSDVQRRLRDLGMEAAVSDPDDFRRLIASEHRKWSDVVRSSGMKAD